MNVKFFDACLKGDSQTIKTLIETFKVNVDIIDINGNTGLFIACRENKENVVKVLINANADVNVINEKDGDTPLIIACSEGYEHIVALLISKGAKKNYFNKNGWSPLIYACYYGHYSVVKLLITCKVEINDKGHVGCSALYRSCNADRLDIVKLLIASGADVNLSNDEKNTPLMISSRNKFIDIVKELLKTKSININLINNDHSNALLEAINCKKVDENDKTYQQQYEIVELLISSGVFINQVNVNGDTGLLIACRIGYIKIVKLLLDSNADVNHINNEDLTALMVAVDHGHEDIVDLLLQSSHINIYLNDINGKTALQHAIPGSSIAKKIESYYIQYEIPKSIEEDINRFSKHPKWNIGYNTSSSDIKMNMIEEEIILRDDDTIDKSMVHIHENVNKLNSNLIQVSNHLNNDSIQNDSLQVRTKQSCMVRMPSNRSISTVSPAMIEYLKQFATRALHEEQQENLIRNHPIIHEYYLTFHQTLSNTILACQTISSGMVADDRKFAVEFLAGGVNTTAGLTGLPLLPVFTGLANLLVSIPNQRVRERTIRRLVTYFPTIESQKYISILSREITIFMQSEIKAVLREAKHTPRRNILDRVTKVVDWVKNVDHLTPVQGLASGHAARLLHTIMNSEQPFLVELAHIPTLICWATGEQIDTFEDKLSNIQELPLVVAPNTSTHTVVVVQQPSPMKPIRIKNKLPTTLESNNNNINNNTNNNIITISDNTITTIENEDEDAQLKYSLIYKQNSDKDYRELSKQMEERILILENCLNMERKSRVALELKLKEIEEIKKQLKLLNTNDEIFNNSSRNNNLLIASQKNTCISNNNNSHININNTYQSVSKQDEVLLQLLIEVELLKENMKYFSSLTISNSNNIKIKPKRVSIKDYLYNKITTNPDDLDNNNNDNRMIKTSVINENNLIINNNNEINNESSNNNSDNNNTITSNNKDIHTTSISRKSLESSKSINLSMDDIRTDSMKSGCSCIIN